MCACVLKLCLTLCNPMHCSLIGFSVHGIAQAKILEWIAISSSRVSSQPRDWIHISFTGRWILYHCTTKEALRIDTNRQNPLASYVRFELKVIIECENQIYSKWPLASLTLIDHKDLLIQFVYNTSLWEMDISWHFSKQRRSQSSAIAATSYDERWRNSACENPGNRPQNLRCISKEWFQWAQTLASSYTEMR